MTTVTVNDLTSGTVDGTGVFDVMLQSVKAHIQQEYAAGRIKGTEYAQVYLGSMQTVMQSALQFVLTKDKTQYEIELLQQQVLTEQQKRLQIEAEIDLINAQIAKTNSEKALVDSQVTAANKQLLLIDEQIITEQKKHAQMDAETVLTNNRADLTVSEKALTDQKVTNAITEETVLKATKCKLDAEFDLIVEQKNRTTQEITKIGSEVSLLNQKTVTEQAQVSSLGIDTDSIIGRQKELYKNQAQGYIRDAEQKAAKLMSDVATVQYTKDEVNLGEAGFTLQNVASVVNVLKQGIGA